MALSTRRLALAVAVVAAGVAVLLYLGAALPSYDYALKYAYAAVILVGGALITREVSVLAGISG